VDGVFSDYVVFTPHLMEMQSENRRDRRYNKKVTYSFPKAVKFSR
jgi:hypothetical protein